MSVRSRLVGFTIAVMAACTALAASQPAGALSLGALLGPVAVPGAPAPTPAANCSPGFYSYETFDVPGSNTTQARDINEAGVIVGMHGADITSTQGAIPMHGFTYNRPAHTFASVDRAPDHSVYFSGINDTGAISGFSGRFNQAGFVIENLHGFKLTGSTFSFVGHAPPFPNDFVNKINDAGNAVGFSVGGDGIPHSFIDSGAGGVEFTAPGALNTYAVGINDLGQVTGTATYSSAPPKTFLRQADGATTFLNNPCGTSGSAQDINNQGTFAGTFADGTGEHGYVMTAAGRARGLDVPGADATRAYGLNDAGQVVGEYYLHGEAHAYVADPAPRHTALQVDPVLVTILPGLAVHIPTMSAVLTDVTTNVAMAGRLVRFSVGGSAVCEARTNVTGRATCTGLVTTVRGALGLGYDATYAGEEDYLPAAGHGALLAIGTQHLP